MHVGLANQVERRLSYIWWMEKPITQLISYVGTHLLTPFHRQTFRLAERVNTVLEPPWQHNNPANFFGLHSSGTVIMAARQIVS